MSNLRSQSALLDAPASAEPVLDSVRSSRFARSDEFSRLVKDPQFSGDPHQRLWDVYGSLRSAGITGRTEEIAAFVADREGHLEQGIRFLLPRGIDGDLVVGRTAVSEARDGMLLSSSWINQKGTVAIFDLTALRDPRFQEARIPEVVAGNGGARVVSSLAPKSKVWVHEVQICSGETLAALLANFEVRTASERPAMLDEHFCLFRSLFNQKLRDELQRRCGFEFGSIMEFCRPSVFNGSASVQFGEDGTPEIWLSGITEFPRFENGRFNGKTGFESFAVQAVLSKEGIVRLSEVRPFNTMS